MLDCMRCIAACPHKTIQMTPEGLLFMPESCSQYHIFTCVKVCPSQAMVRYGDTMQVLKNMPIGDAHTPWVKKTGY